MCLLPRTAVSGYCPRHAGFLRLPRAPGSAPHKRGAVRGWRNRGIFSGWHNIDSPGYKNPTSTPTSPVYEKYMHCSLACGGYLVHPGASKSCSDGTCSFTATGCACIDLQLLPNVVGGGWEFDGCAPFCIIRRDLAACAKDTELASCTCSEEWVCGRAGCLLDGHGVPGIRQPATGLG